MSLLSPILVPFDGSPHSLAATAFARRIAAATGAPTHLLHVADAPLPGLEDAARAFPTPVTFGTVSGSVESVIAEEAARLDAGLVLMGARGRSVLTGLVFGSTARGVLTACHRPTMVVHGPMEDYYAGGGSVVAALDGGEVSARVAEHARALATALGASVKYATVMNVDRHLARHPEAYGVSAERWRGQVEAYAARAFGDLPANDTVVRFGVPSWEVRELAVSTGAGVVVCGRRGQTGAEVDAWRSVAFALATQGPFATLVI